MKGFQYTVTDKDGIHARPAGLLVKAMQRFSSDITITKGEKTVDAKKLFALMSLAVKQGETIAVSASGDDEQAAIEAAETFLSENL